MKTYQVTLPDEFAVFVDRLLAEKKWDTVEDLIIAGLLRIQDDIGTDPDSATETLRAAVRIGIDQADRGELADGPSVLQRLREKLETARKQPT